MLRTCWVWHHWIVVWPLKPLFKMKWSTVKPKGRRGSTRRSQAALSLGTPFSVRHEERKVPRPKLWSHKCGPRTSVETLVGDVPEQDHCRAILSGMLFWPVWRLIPAYLYVHPLKNIFRTFLMCKACDKHGTHQATAVCVPLGLPAYSSQLITEQWAAVNLVWFQRMIKVVLTSWSSIRSFFRLFDLTSIR